MIEIKKEIVKEKLPQIPINANKGTRGTLLSITGSYQMAGAAILSLRAALKCGVGLVKQVIPKSIYEIVAKNVLEAVYYVYQDSISGTVSRELLEDINNLIDGPSAILIGCGLKNTDEVYELVSYVIKNSSVPVVIDADGLNALSKNIDLLLEAKSTVILTPHILEMSRLTGMSKEYILDNKEIVVTDFTNKYKNVVLVLKDYQTYINSYNEEIYVNTTGNQGMAKGGSGDVLSGIISSLLAQRIKPMDAAVLGTYIHGSSGDLAKLKFGEFSMQPSDLIKEIPKVFMDIK